MKVCVINYGMGNLGSVRRALEECGADVILAESPEAISEVERIVLPGVGAFPDAMAKLNATGWSEAIHQALTNPAIHLLGICLGMQLLADKGFEVRETQGLGLISGKVTRLSSSCGERIPHVGWNEIHNLSVEHPLIKEVREGTDFYFVHSFHFCPTNEAHVLATTRYCGQFASVVGAGNVYGTQFHPEKSSRAGFQIFRNFLSR